MKREKALIVVDAQEDFMPGGPLPAQNGREIVDPINQTMEIFDDRDDCIIVATQDWHPPDHGSFASNHEGHEPGEIVELDGLDQILWPDHCVQNTEGAEFVDGLDDERFKAIFRKGVDPLVDSYSGFYDNDYRRSTGLEGFLAGFGVEEVYIVGVATDYCVKFTALDAVESFDTYLLRDGCRGVEQSKGDIEAAIEEMEDVGVKISDVDLLDM